MLTLTPAYGRDYNSVSAVKADFEANKDFIVNDITSPYDGKACNAADLRNDGITRVMIRYGKLRKVAPFDVPEDLNWS